MKKVILAVLLIIFVLPPPIFANSLWDITSVDTMKYSRDASRDPAVAALIPTQVKAVADTGANYIAIDTPYDDEFIPRLTLWVNEARKDHLKVWFRGNFSGWEGWFEYPKLTTAQQHIQKTYRFITQNPDLFEDGDLFTPAPEAENGILGDPRQTGRKGEFNQFLLDSFDNCTKSFAQIQKQVNCGVWSENPDALRESIYPSTIQKLGSIISIDDYTNTPEKLLSDIKSLHTMFNARVVLGEFGAPIPDINGNMTEAQQATYVQKVLQYAYQNRDIVAGMNYWVINGGSTQLINDDGSARQAYFELQKYYQPLVISGLVRNQLNQLLAGVQVATTNKTEITTTDLSGRFALTLPSSDNSISLTRDDLKTIEQNIAIIKGQDQQFDLVMEPQNPDFWYKLKLWWQNLVKGS